MEQLELNDELYNNLCDYLEIKKYSQNTINQYKINLHKIFKRNKILDKPTTNKLMKSFKHQNQRSVLTLINNYCYDNDIDFSIKIPSIVNYQRKIPQILSVDEIKIIIQALPKPYDLMFRCIYNFGAGLRISEALKITWNVFNWVDWLQSKDYGICIIKSSKGGKDRVVNIPKKLMNDLYEYAKELNILNEFMVPVGGTIFNFNISEFKPDLFKTDIDEWKRLYIKHSYDFIRYNLIKKYCEPAINKKIKIHSLRSSRATYLHEYENVPIEEIKILLGHVKLETTMIYTRINPLSVFDRIKETKEI